MTSSLSILHCWVHCLHTVIDVGLEYSFLISAILSINVNANVRLLGNRWKAAVCEYILPARNQILFLFISKTESAIVCPSVIVCILLLVISPHHICSTPPPLIGSILRESSLSCHGFTWIHTLYGKLVRHCCPVGFSVAAGVSVTRTHAHTWAHRHHMYSRRCLCLVAVLKLVHICSSIDPCEHVLPKHTVAHFESYLSDSACVCVVLQRCRIYRFFKPASCGGVFSFFYLLLFLDMWESVCGIQISTQAMNLTPTSLQDHRRVHAGIVTAAPILAAVYEQDKTNTLLDWLYAHQYSDASRVRGKRTHSKSHNLHFTSECGAGERKRGGN